MATAPWAEHTYKVVIEFRKGGGFGTRKVSLTHSASVVPPQLYGRIDPNAWGALLTDCEKLAQEHPYVAKPTVDCCCSNLLASLSFLVIGFGCFQGDSGDYDMWLHKVQQVLAIHRAYYLQCGCTLSVQSVHGGFWVQVDISPAAGQPGAGPMYGK